MLSKKLVAVLVAAMAAFVGCTGDSLPQAGATVDANSFLTKVVNAMADVTSYHGDGVMTSGQGGTQITMEVDARNQAQVNRHSVMTSSQGSVEYIVYQGATFTRYASIGWVKESSGNADASTDLVSLLQDAEADLSRVVFVGPQQVQGAPSAHYRLTSNNTSPSASVPAAQADLDVWLDASSRIVKISAQSATTGSFEMELSNFNQPVTISPPKQYITQG